MLFIIEGSVEEGGFMEEDRRILEGICRREQEAFQQLIDKYGRYVVAVCVKVSGGQLASQDMEELAADVFTKLWEKGRELQLKNGSLKNLIGVMARNRTLNFLRSKNRTLTDQLEEEMISCPSAEAHYMEQEMAAALWEAINILEPLDKELFLRRYFFLERVSDIARMKAMNEKTVSSRLSRARQKLQKIIDQKGGIRYEA